MPTLYPILWIPYLCLLYFLYKKKSIYAVILLLCFGALNYRLPLHFGFEGKLFHAGVLFCLVLSMLDFSVRPSHGKYDHIIWFAVLAYFLFIFISVLFAKYDRLPTKIYSMVDQSLLFFVTIKCIKDKKDVNTLFKGVIFAVCIMAGLGLIGYAVNDPWWGQQVYDDPMVMEARNPSLPYHVQVRLFGQWEGRVASTASNANALGATMILAFPIAIYLWFSAKSLVEKLIVSGGMAILIATVGLSGSLTAVFSGIVVSFVLFIGLLGVKKGRVSFFDYVFGVTVSLLIVLSVATSDYFTAGTVQRLKRTQNITDFLELGNRIFLWKEAVTELDVTFLAVGRGRPGPAWRKGAHSNYLGIIYKGGLWAFVAFGVFFLRAIQNALRLQDRLMAICFSLSLIAYALCSITQESAVHNGPGYVFWPVIAILSNRVAMQLSPYPRKRLKEPRPTRLVKSAAPLVD